MPTRLETILINMVRKDIATTEEIIAIKAVCESVTADIEHWDENTPIDFTLEYGEHATKALTRLMR